VSTLFKILLLPPFNMFALGLAGWLAGRRWRRVGRTVVVLAVAGLVAQSLPACSGLLLRSLERFPALGEDDFDSDAGAIVVLAGDIYWAAPEYGGDTVGKTTLERVRYGAWLHRATGVPLLTSGGTMPPAREPLGELMARTLREEFGVPVRWVEAESDNTFTNARFSAEILRAEGVSKVYVVTSASHMWRSKAAFEAAGLEVIPAPTDLSPPLDPVVGDFVPDADAMRDSATALYEWFGMLWYRLAYY
jgi:uncharacterized SAM-binding protein YcdF (DUF218 family)